MEKIYLDTYEIEDGYLIIFDESSFNSIKFDYKIKKIKYANFCVGVFEEDLSEESIDYQFMEVIYKDNGGLSTDGLSLHSINSYHLFHTEEAAKDYAKEILKENLTKLQRYVDKISASLEKD